MWAFLKQINAEGTTIILTTHYLEEAENLCRNIAIIDQGYLVENTSMRTLLRQVPMEIFVLDLEHPIDQAPLDLNIKMTLVDNYTLEVELPETQNINYLYKELSNRGIYVRSMRNKSNRLEQRFMTLVDQKNYT